MLQGTHPSTNCACASGPQLSHWEGPCIQKVSFIAVLPPTDKDINIDQVLQQLQELTPHWRAVGKAAYLVPATMIAVSLYTVNETKKSSSLSCVYMYIPPNIHR